MPMGQFRRKNFFSKKWVTNKYVANRPVVCPCVRLSVCPCVRLYVTSTLPKIAKNGQNFFWAKNPNYIKSIFGSKIPFFLTKNFFQNLYLEKLFAKIQYPLKTPKTPFAARYLKTVKNWFLKEKLTRYPLPPQMKNAHSVGGANTTFVFIQPDCCKNTL